MYDIIIVGAGPAGISAGLYARRANKNVLIIYSGESNLEKAEKIDNYYGFVNGISGKDLYENGIRQAENLGVQVKKEEVLNIEMTLDGFAVKTIDNVYESSVCIIATGNKKLRPNIKGIIELEGKGVSYCAICDGFFYRNKNVVVIGNGKYAVSEAKDLENIVQNVKILTDGKEMEADTTFDVDTRKISQIIGEDRVEAIKFEDGNTIDVNGVFIALGEAGGSDFAKKLGVILDKDSIKVDENMATNVKGLYSCGNSTGGLLQVSKAVYEGAVAGLSAVKYLNERK